MFTGLFRKKRTSQADQVLQVVNESQSKTIEFDRTIRIVESFMQDDYSKREKVDYVRFVKRTILFDVQYDYLTQLMYRGQHNTVNVSRLTLLPTTYMNTFGEKSTIATGEKEKIAVKDVGVLVTGWKLKDFKRAMIDVMREGFRSTHKDKEIVHHYTDIGLAVVYQKNHHLMASTMMDTGEMIVDIYDTKKMFPYITTDGAWWYQKNPRTKAVEKVLEVYDFRIAVLYELEKMIQTLMMKEMK